MKTNLKLSHTVIERLLGVKKACYGKLYGIFSKNNIAILGLQVDLDSGDNLLNNLPAELDFCGVFRVGQVDHDWVREYASEVDVTDSPVYINVDDKLSCYIITNDQLEVVTYTTLSDHDVYSQFVHIRLKGLIPVKCEANAKVIEETFTEVRKMVTSGTMGFNFVKPNVYLLGNEFENAIIGLTADSTVAELCGDTEGVNEGSSKKKKAENFKFEVIEVGLLKRSTRIDTAEIKYNAPICVLDKKQTTVFKIDIVLDTLSVVNRQTKVLKLYEILVESAIRNLRLYEATLLDNLSVNETNLKVMQQLETYHFCPQNCGHFITCIYPKNCTDLDLKKKRQLLHDELLLKSHIPIFRRGNKYIFNNSMTKILINPHEAVKKTDNGGQICLVKGKYEYYHYCQDRMDDNGWGCAYRSLQTLASWFKLQGFVDCQVPTFKEIQKCLVDIGDKPRNFIDSRQWIGSTEVSFVLNSLLGITSKILFVSSGEEMPSKGPELINHFENHGSPIMIGGGVLAHTILGVDYNRETGNLKFLILDPHYTGGEDLQVIVNKGWCGWKNADFWDKNAHYNMCLPQVPREI